jgi:asparagine synthase (glutamine-hydrolysing)
VPSQRILHTVERALPANQVRIRTATRVIAESSYQDRLRAWFAPFSARERDQLLGRRRVRPLPAAFLDSRGDSLDTMLFADTAVLLPDSLLERGDRMSMAASLEVRPPFADHRLVELAFSLPNNVKIRDRTTKWVLKEVARRYLPSRIVDRPKVGFRVPLDQWFRNDLQSVSFDMLTSASSYVRNNLDSALVNRILTDHLNGRRDEEWRIWTLLSLEFWYQELAARLAASPSPR